MVKQIATLIICALVGGFIGGVVVNTASGNGLLAGQTHLSGLSVGSDGLEVTDGGTVSLGSGSISSTGAFTNTGTSELSRTIEGDSVHSTSTLTTAFGPIDDTLLTGNKIITLTPNISSATSTLSIGTTTLSDIGNVESWILRNGTSTAAYTVGIAAGTGVNITSNTFTNVQIPADGNALLTCGRISAGIIDCLVDIKVEGD